MNKDGSPPVRGRGLKHKSKRIDKALAQVAPRAGAWIETTIPRLRHFRRLGRPPCGGVD